MGEQTSLLRETTSWYLEVESTHISSSTIYVGADKTVSNIIVAPI